MMSTVGRRIPRLLVTAAAALAFAVAPSIMLSDAAPEAKAQPCYDGVVPGNPYVPSCTLPGPQHKIRGSAPDAAAIIACKNWPGCLAWYVNGP
jgi:hypothetical protein